MQIVRMVIWILALVVVLLFTLANWDQHVTVLIWQNLVWDTRLPAVVIVSFLLGMVPMWLILRGTSWRLNRRIAHLEQVTRNFTSSRSEPAHSDADEVPAEREDYREPGSRSE